VFLESFKKDVKSRRVFLQAVLKNACGVGFSRGSRIPSGLDEIEIVVCVVSYSIIRRM